jgi:hypothetical protein
MSDDLNALIQLIDHNQVYADLEEVDREAYLQARSMLLEQADRIAALTAERDALALQVRSAETAIRWAECAMSDRGCMPDARRAIDAFRALRGATEGAGG